MRTKKINHLAELWTVLPHAKAVYIGELESLNSCDYKCMTNKCTQSQYPKLA